MNRSRAGTARRTYVAAVLSVLSAGGCNLLGGIAEKQLAADPAIGATTGSAGGGGEGGASAGAGGAGGCSANVAVDSANCGACGHDCLGGACEAGRCRPVALAEAAFPIGVAVDATHVYFAEKDGHRLQRVAKHGGDPELLYTVDPATTCAPTVLALDDAYVYTSVYSYGSTVSWIARVPKTGGAPAVLADGLIGSWPILIDGDRLLVGNRWDARYLVSLDKAGGDLQTLATSTLPCCQPDPLGTFCCEDVYDLAVDAESFYLAGGQKLERLPKQGGAVEVIGGSTQAAVAVEADETDVYWAGEGHVWRTPKAALGSREPLAPVTKPAAMAIDATHVYFTQFGGSDSATGELRRVRKDGTGAVEVLASGLRGASYVALDEDAAYVSVEFDGVVLMVAK